LLILAAAGPGAPMAAEDLGRMSTPEIPERSAMP
jgi:hypothetical protein